MVFVSTSPSAQEIVTGVGTKSAPAAAVPEIGVNVTVTAPAEKYSRDMLSAIDSPSVVTYEAEASPSRICP